MTQTWTCTNHSTPIPDIPVDWLCPECMDKSPQQKLKYQGWGMLLCQESIQKWTPHDPTERQALYLSLKDEREVFYGGAAGGGKALAIDTLLPTPTGWVMMGDVRVGDQVFSDGGQPCNVVGVSDIHHEATYKVVFSDGSELIAGSNHRWETSTLSERTRELRNTDAFRSHRRALRSKRGRGKRPDLALRNTTTAKHQDLPRSDIRTTEEIRQTLYIGKRVNHSVRVAQPVQLPEADLLIEPYVLGAWLGDGAASAGAIAGIDEEVFLQVAGAGYTVTRRADRYSRGVLGLQTQLRQLGLYRNKHIPPAYLRASHVQRLALLQGLMDTDGYCDVHGQCEITLTNKRLADDVIELITSLGAKCVMKESAARLEGRYISQRYRMKFMLADGAFRLPRKLIRQKRDGFRGTHNRRYVVAVLPVESVPLKCIEVDSPSHLYLAGRQMIPTHNSDVLLMAALEYVHVPNYSALLLRKSYADLSKPGALMDRAQQWLRGSAAKWNEQKKQWTFPSGAKLSFGYMETENDKYQYQGAEYQLIAPDEVTQFTESQYTYLFSRLRRLKDSDIPIRMRPASNPGGIGARWVQERFVPDNFTPEMAVEPCVFWKEGENADGSTVKRAFIPARLDDNPHLDRAEYAQSLNELDAVTREQLLKGDWQIRERGNVFPMFEDGEDGRHIITWEQFKEVIGVSYVPTHWLGAHGHDPGFDPDPRAAVWNFVAAQNSPAHLAGDVFCIRELYANRMTVDDFAEEVKRAESPLNEASRIRIRTIGHEASSEQATLAQKHKLNYVKLKPDANGGIAQWRHALRVTDFDKPHPFKPHTSSCRSSSCGGCLFGRPHFYVVVPKEQLKYPKDSKGMVNFRAEMVAYRYIDGSPTQSRGMPRIVPYDFFNHLMDAQRGIASKWFAQALPLTDAERIESKVHPNLKAETIEQAVQAGVRDRQGAMMARIAEIERIRLDEQSHQWVHPLAEYDL